MQNHEHWLLIALEDLNSAKHLFLQAFTTTLFHVQQCAEKSLKAYLISQNQPIVKTHDLVKLIDVCLKLNRQFEILRQTAADLNPYETAGRYPDNTFKKPKQEKIQVLIEQSEYVFNFVTNQINR